MNIIRNCLVKTDDFCDYIPVISSITNLVNLFQKCVVLPFIDKATISSNHYYKHINEKSFVRCLFLVIPVIGNMIVGIYDFTKNNEAIKLSLKHLKATSSSKQFVYLSKPQIEEKGGICLTSCSEHQYEGFVASKENSLWVLHICPGGGYESFSEDDFSKMLPEVIQGLHNNRVNIEAFVIDGRHPGDTKKNFEKWQNTIN